MLEHRKEIFSHPPWFQDKEKGTGQKRQRDGECARFRTLYKCDNNV